MSNTSSRHFALASLLLTLVSPSAFAQSGSAGGSIGNDEKSLSGSRQDGSSGRSAEPAPSARRSKPATDEQRSSARRGGGSGGGGSFDGAWAVTSVGCGGTSSGATVVTSGRVIGQGVSGTVSANGSVHTFGQGDGGITYTGAGRLSARSGSGTFRRSDGCSGTWTASKQ
ncbi:hypothetical protein [Bradyrhizobium sp. CCBAU 53338]|uniref:hypothetical protein n=1 Tax=Bradyrhizobium sp. CCBAU 53338 TaxID=1325111 RepID=UPI001889EC31|nr:hypothetical protein [Bradyrhizobium sp. CCBAU 53338]QOZ56275.1 hypothetical protein XH90_21320 [Bradyrhizobium sp. CCBAU 53338]